MEQSPRVIDVVTSLIQLGRVEEAVDFLINVVVLSEEHGTDNLAILGLTIDEYISLLYPKPLPKVKGRWDTVLYGEAAFR